MQSTVLFYLFIYLFSYLFSYFFLSIFLSFFLSFFLHFFLSLFNLFVFPVSSSLRLYCVFLFVAFEG